MLYPMRDACVFPLKSHDQDVHVQRCHRGISSGIGKGIEHHVDGRITCAHAALVSVGWQKCKSGRIYAMRLQLFHDEFVVLCIHQRQHELAFGAPKTVRHADRQRGESLIGLTKHLIATLPVSPASWRNCSRDAASVCGSICANGMTQVSNQSGFSSWKRTDSGVSTIRSVIL